jgi:excisionase family DNA binding protein
MNDKTNKLMTRQEAADYLQVDVGTLEVWASTGRYNIPFYKVGRCARYKQEDLDRFIEDRKVTNETWQKFSRKG